MDESFYFINTRNCKQETICCIQETKTIFDKFFTLILKRNRYFNGFSHFYGKKTNKTKF